MKLAKRDCNRSYRLKVLEAVNRRIFLNRMADGKCADVSLLRAGKLAMCAMMEMAALECACGERGLA